MFSLIFLGLILLLNSCTKSNIQEFTCMDCHKKESLPFHNKISCTKCHGGVERVKTKELAHKNLKKSLSHYEIESLCGECHFEKVKNFKNSLHFTYEKELRTIFKGFGLPLKVKNLHEFSKIEIISSKKEELLIDFLRRRCFNCHIFSRGEDYPKTRRERGCLSCHKPHKFSKPDDSACLSCHYSTKVGWDYYGFSPHPWFIDYRSPFVEGKLPERPYGIEAYPLREDVHKEKGFSCISCHKKEEIMEGKNSPSCLSCHKNLSQNPFHKQRVLKEVRCEVCHATFLNQDELTVCYLEEKPNWEDWLELAFQESSEIEKLINFYLEGKEVKPVMRDKLTDMEKEGIWLCTLENRTYNKLKIERDEKGRFCIKRQEKLKLNSGDLELEGIFKVCKVPHTIGKADLNRALTILKNLKTF